jgi:hypothetical protein
MIVECAPAVALQQPHSQDMFVSSRVRQLLEQANRAFRLAEAMTNRADTEWLEQIGRSLLEQARRAIEEEGVIEEEGKANE